jgi:hypothetical protein
METGGGRCPVPSMDGQTKAGGPVGVKVCRIFCNIVEDVSCMSVDVEHGSFEVNGGSKVMVFSQFAWINKYVRWERIESMKRARRVKRWE